MAEEVIQTTLRSDSAQFRRDFKQSETTLDQFARKSGQAVGFSTAQFAKMSKASRVQVMELQKSSRAMQAQERSAKNLRKAQGNLGLGALEASRAIEDFSVAGMRGALNNIPQVITLLGGAAGLAAAISVTAVAGTILVPKLLGISDALGEMREKLRGTLDAQHASEERAAALADEIDGLNDAQVRYLGTVRSAVREAQKEGRIFEDNTRRALEQKKAAEELHRAKVAAGLAEDAGKGRTNQLRAELDLEQRRLEIFERQAKALNKRRDLENGRGTQGDVDGARDAVRSRQARLNKVLTSEFLNENEIKGKTADDFETAREFAEFIENNLGAALGAQGGDRGRKEAVLGAVQQLNLLRAAEDDLKLAQEELKVSAQGGAAAMRVLGQAVNAADEQIKKSFHKIQALETQLETQQQIEALPKRSVVPEGAGGLFDAMTRGTVDRIKAKEKERKASKDRDGRRMEFAAEMRALQLEANGQGRLAEEVRNQMRMRAEGLEISRQLGVSEEHGLRLAREKAGWEEKIKKEKEAQAALGAEEEEAGGGRKIRLLNQRETLRRHINRGGKMNAADRRMIGATGLMGRKIGRGRRIGLKQGAEQREADQAEAAAQREVQAMAGAGKAEESPKWAANLVEMQEKLLKLWQGQFN